MVSSELLKEQTELESEDVIKQVSDMTTKLEDTEKQLMEKHSMNLVEPSCALNGIHKRKSSADRVSFGNFTHDEFHSFQSDHEKPAAMGECKESEAQVIEKLINTTEENETMKLEHLKALNITDTIASELEESKAKVKALEIMVSKLQSDLVLCGNREVNVNELTTDDAQQGGENGQNEEMEQLKSEIMNLKYEDYKLRAALEAAEMRYQELRLQNTLDVRSAYEQVESTSFELKSKDTELQKANSDIKDLQAKLAEKELLSEAEKHQRRELETRFAAIQETLLEKHNLLQYLEKENKSLKQELKKATDGTVADNLVEARAAEKESDKNSKRTARVIEQLDAAQVANAELEAELRKLKVQCDQWRKAAEAAATMLTSGNNGKYIDRTDSLDSGYHTLGGRISSPFSDDIYDEGVDKKNGNMLKKIGVLWKKGQN